MKYCTLSVLDELTSFLISQEMITELVKPQEAYGHTLMKQLIEDIAQSSIMRLDPVSMDRLWDLVTMVFKWQATVSDDIIGITARHLYEIETFTTNPDTQLQLHRVQNLVDNFKKILSLEEKYRLRECILVWLQEFNVRISLLLRLGFQNQDGSFKGENIDPSCMKMIENIGENIYAATKKLNLSKVPKKTMDKEHEAGKRELNLMINQILGENNTDKILGDGSQIFRLTMCDTYEENESINQENSSQVYSEISVSNSNDTLKDIFDDITVSNSDDVSDLHDELLNILDEDC